jgi:putative transposase
MNSTAANLMENVLPEGVPLRQWVLTFPFPWRKRLAYDGKLLSALTRIFITTVLAFYQERTATKSGGRLGQSGAVVALQRTSSDLKCNPHIHAVFLDGLYHEVDAHGDDEESQVVFAALSHLSTTEVSSVLERTTRRMNGYLRRRRLLEANESAESRADGLVELAASATSGTTPPAGPEWRRGALRFVSQPMAVERPLSVALDGFTLHAATRAGGLDVQGREALLRYILRPAIAQERILQGPDGLVRIALKSRSRMVRPQWISIRSLC